MLAVTAAAAPPRSLPNGFFSRPGKDREDTAGLVSRLRRGVEKRGNLIALRNCTVSRTARTYVVPPVGTRCRHFHAPGTPKDTRNANVVNHLQQLYQYRRSGS